MDDRSVIITIYGGKSYDMICTTKAAEIISEKYGSLEECFSRLMKMEKLSENASMLIWLVTLLINQGIQVRNLLHRDETPMPLVDEEELKLLTAPADYKNYWILVAKTIKLGLRRNVQSEEDESSKNSTVG